MKTLFPGCLLFLLVVASAFSEGPFLDLKFEEALKKAGQENKIVLIDFYTTWCGPCKILDQKTWPDAAVQKLLGEKTIPLKMDAEVEKVIAAKYKIDSYPTILLLKPDGTEIDRLIGFMEPPVFIATFNDSLAGKDAVARAREKVEKDGGKSPMSRMDLAAALMHKGNYPAALDEYLWCYDKGVEADPAFQGVRSSFLLSDLVALGQKYPPALAALNTRRDAQEKTALTGTMDESSVFALALLNEYLDQREKSLLLFDKLPAKSRGVFLKMVLDQLVAAKRYKDILDNGDPDTAFASEEEEFNQSVAAIGNDANRKEFEQFRKKSIVTLCASYFEALAGTGKNKEALDFAGKILKFSDAPETRAVLIKSADRAGNTDVAGKLKDGAK